MRRTLDTLRCTSYSRPDGPVLATQWSSAFQCHFRHWIKDLL